MFKRKKMKPLVSGEICSLNNSFLDKIIVPEENTIISRKKENIILEKNTFSKNYSNIKDMLLFVVTGKSMFKKGYVTIEPIIARNDFGGICEIPKKLFFRYEVPSKCLVKENLIDSFQQYTGMTTLRGNYIDRYGVNRAGSRALLTSPEFKAMYETWECK